MVCKVCKESYHHCSSCDRDWHQEEGYCSSNCFEKTDKYKEAVELYGFLLNEIEPKLKHNTDIYEILDIITETMC